MGRITRWKGKDLFDGEPERGECDVCVEAVREFRDHSRTQKGGTTTDAYLETHEEM